MSSITELSPTHPKWGVARPCSELLSLPRARSHFPLGLRAAALGFPLQQVPSGRAGVGCLGPNRAKGTGAAEPILFNQSNYFMSVLLCFMSVLLLIYLLRLQLTGSWGGGRGKQTSTSVTWTVGDDIRQPRAGQGAVGLAPMPPPCSDTAEAPGRPLQQHRVTKASVKDRAGSR